MVAVMYLVSSLFYFIILTMKYFDTPKSFIIPNIYSTDYSIKHTVFTLIYQTFVAQCCISICVKCSQAELIPTFCWYIPCKREAKLWYNHTKCMNVHECTWMYMHNKILQVEQIEQIDILTIIVKITYYSINIKETQNDRSRALATIQYFLL